MSERYRVGRHLGRTVYDGDELIGVMDTVELGQLVVLALNGGEELRDALDEINQQRIADLRKEFERQIAGRVREELARISEQGPLFPSLDEWRGMSPRERQGWNAASYRAIVQSEVPNASSQVAPTCSHIGEQSSGHQDIECGHDGGDGTVCIKHVHVDPNDGERYHGGGHMFASEETAARMRDPHRDSAELIAGMRGIPKSEMAS